MRYRFGDFEFRADSCELFERGEPRRLQMQPAKLLLLLLERRGAVLGRDEIEAALWGEDHFVEVTQGINYAIRQIRLALGDCASDPRYIETLPKLGYRLIAEVRTDETRGARAAAPSVEAAPPPGRRLASALLSGFAVVAVLGLLTSRLLGAGEPLPELRVTPLLSVESAQVDDGRHAAVREQMMVSLTRAFEGTARVYAGSTAETQSTAGVWVLSGVLDAPPGRPLRLDLRLSDATGLSLWAGSFEGSPNELDAWLGSLPGHLESNGSATYWADDASPPRSAASSASRTSLDSPRERASSRTARR